MAIIITTSIIDNTIQFNWNSGNCGFANNYSLIIYKNEEFYSNYFYDGVTFGHIETNLTDGAYSALVEGYSVDPFTEEVIICDTGISDVVIITGYPDEGGGDIEPNIINNISFTLKSKYNGNGFYYLYNSPLCESNLILSGTTNIINGSSNIDINQEFNFNETISIKFIDVKGCETCQNFDIVIPTGETTTTTTTTLPPLSYNTYYLASPRSITDTDSSGCVDIYDYCISPGFLTTNVVYANTIDPTVSSLLNVFLYTDTNLTIPFIGLGNDFRYAVSNINGLNTFTEGNTSYNLIIIDENGFVSTIEANSCDCEGNGGGPVE